MLNRSLRTVALLGIALVLVFFATGCDQFLSSAIIYMQQNPPEYEKAIAQLNEGLTVVPDHGEYYRWLAFCYYNNKQYQEAHDAYAKAIQFLPDKKDSLIAIRDTDWYRLYAMAVKDYNKYVLAVPESLQFFMDRASKSLDNAVTFFPDKVQNYSIRAKIFLKAGKPDEAKKIFEKMVVLDPKNTEGYLALGRDAYNNAKYGQAEEFFKKALAVNPADTATYGLLGQSYFAEEKYGDAAEAFRKAAQLDPANRINLLRWATAIYNDGKNLTAAFEPLDKAAKLEDDEEVWMRTGMTAIRMTPPDCDRAITAFKKAISFNPTMIDYWRYLRDCYSAKKMKAEVKETDKKIKELEKSK